MKLLILLGILAVMGGFSQIQARSSRNVYPCPLFGETRLPHSWSCSRYIQCINLVAVEEQCADGLHYNADTQQCMEPAQARCTVEDNPCPKWSDPEDMVYLSNPRSCDSYFLCFMGEAKPLACADGFVFNATTNQCDRSQCSTNFWSCHLNGTYVAPDDSDCSRFFHCVNGVQYGVGCREGLLFDSISERCVDPRDAVCGHFTTVPATTPTVPNTSWIHSTPTTEMPVTSNTTTTARPTTNTTTRRPSSTTTHRPHTQRPSTTQKATTSTTQRPNTTTTRRPTTTQRTTTSTTQKSTTQKATTTTTAEPTTTTTQKATTTTQVTTSTTAKPTSTTTVKPTINLDDYCKVHDVGAIAVVAHPERCDWYIQCVLGHGHKGECEWYQIFSPNKKRCVLGNSTTCKYADELDEFASHEVVLAVEAVDTVDPVEVAAVEVVPNEQEIKPLD